MTDEFARYFNNKWLSDVCMVNTRRTRGEPGNPFIVRTGVEQVHFTDTICSENGNPIGTPVKDPCRFLSQTIRYSQISGAPQGVRQRCVHPHHYRYELLRVNFKEFIGHVSEVVHQYQRLSAPEELRDIILIPSVAEVRLVQERIYRLDTICRTMLRELNRSFTLDEVGVDNKEYVKPFK